MNYGPGSLSTAELIAILIRVGVKGESAVRLGERLLTQFKGLRGLARASIQELCQVHGLGPAKAVQLKAGLELGRRLLLTAPEDRPTITSPADVANQLMLDLALEDQEHLWVVLLDSRNRVMEVDKVYKGSLHTTVVRTGELLRNAVRHNAAAIILVHNHPSGDPSPSPQDVRLTEQVVQAGKLMDIDVLDHIIIGGQRYVSLKERGLGF
jgi:DNA repair protein RadC